jgi:hypothetical protein
MPHYRTRPMLVVRGVQPTGPDRRAPVRPIPGLTEAVVSSEVEVVGGNADVKQGVDTDADDGENAYKIG